jgi:hypothetical protein
VKERFCWACIPCREWWPCRCKGEKEFLAEHRMCMRTGDQYFGSVVGLVRLSEPPEGFVCALSPVEMLALRHEDGFRG